MYRRKHFGHGSKQEYSKCLLFAGHRSILMLAAREVADDDVARSVARACGQAVATAHVIPCDWCGSQCGVSDS